MASKLKIKKRLPSYLKRSSNGGLLVGFIYVISFMSILFLALWQTFESEKNKSSISSIDGSQGETSIVALPATAMLSAMFEIFASNNRIKDDKDLYKEIDDMISTVTGTWCELNPFYMSIQLYKSDFIIFINDGKFNENEYKPLSSKGFFTLLILGGSQGSDLLSYRLAKVIVKLPINLRKKLIINA